MIASTIRAVRRLPLRPLGRFWPVADWPLALSCAALGCIFFLVSWHSTGPAYLEDEIGYLGNAAFFAGHRIDTASSYHAGYSLLIAPLFWMSDPFVVWKGVLAVNAMLWAASFAMLHSMLRRLLPDASRADLMTATFVSALYPTWIVSSSYALATPAFVAVFMASILALFFWRKNNPFSLLPHSALVGYLYWIHPTGAAVALASLPAVAFDAWRRRDARALLLHLVAVAALTLGYSLCVHPWIAASVTPPGYAPHSHYPSLASALRTVFTAHGAAVYIAMLAGQFAYFIVASFGVACAGLVFCASQVVSGRADENDDARPIHAYMILAPLGIMALGAMSFFEWPRFEGDFWIYGRYLDGAALPLLAIGLAVFRADKKLALLAIFLTAAGVLLDLMAAPGLTHNIVNTVAFWPQYLTHGSGFPVWMLIGAVAVVAVAWFGKRLAIGLMVAAFPLSVYHQIVWHDGILANFSAPSSLVDIVRNNFAPGTCVGFDPQLPAGATLFQSERYHLNSFYLFDYGYRRMSPAEWLAQCNGPFLTYDASALLAGGRARLVAREIKSNLFLVRKADGPDLQLPKNPPADIELENSPR
jgi:hypothetical protein